MYDAPHVNVDLLVKNAEINVLCEVNRELYSCIVDKAVDVGISM